MTKPTRLDYLQYLLTIPVNYTHTHLRLTVIGSVMIKLIVILLVSFVTRYVWESVQPHLGQTPWQLNALRTTAHNFT